MNTKNLIYLFSLVIILFASCRKDSLTTEIIETPNQPEINIEATINGFITDRNGEALPDVQVTLLNVSTETNEFGFFEITGLVNEKFAVIKVEKIGYFDQFETLVPSKDVTSQTRIQMTEKILSGSFASSNGGEISISQNASVQFQANSIVDEQGNLYNGTVNVYSFYIDPTDTDVDQIMPGNLMARNINDEIQVLESYGMVNIILEGAGGQKLNINKTATITTEVPSSISSTAPDEIPLWYFDEEKGLWIEEGKAVLQNGKYIGEVEHFTTWNFDIPGEPTLISGQIFDNDGVAILKVRITDVATGASFTTWTDETGGFAGYVPQDVNLLLEILDICGTTVLFSQNIGSFSTEEEDLGIFNISSNTNFSLVTGTLVDCNQNPVSNGKIIFHIETHSFYQQTSTNASGEFSALIPTCDLAEIEISGIDLNTELVSATQILQVSPTINAGQLLACINVDPSLGTVTINIDGLAPKVFDNCYVSINNINNTDTIAYLFVYLEDLGNGDTIQYFYSLKETNNDINNPNFQQSLYLSYSPPSNAASSLTFDAYNNIFFQSNTVVTVDQAASNVGEILEVTLDNVRISVKEYDANGPDPVTVYNDSSISFSGVIK